MTDREQPADPMSALEQEVREEVEEIKGFYIHAGVFVLVNIFLIVLNFITSPEYFWAIWPLLGWGVGLGSHAVAVFGLFGIGSQAWEEQKVREKMLQRQRGLSADQVRQLFREEMDAGSLTSAAGPPDMERILRRLENLEAIVTSQVWDVMHDEALPEAERQRALAQARIQLAPPDEPSDADRVAQIARRLKN